MTNDVAWLNEQGQHWAGLQSLVMVELGIANKRLKAGWDVLTSAGCWASDIDALHAIALR